MIRQNPDSIPVIPRARGVTKAYTGKGKVLAKQFRNKNLVGKLREDLLLSRAELARKAGLSAVTVNRVEKGLNCRMSTKRKILLALGCKLEDKDRVFLASQGTAGS